MSGARVYPPREQLILPLDAFSQENLLEEPVEGNPEAKAVFGPVTEWASPAIETVFKMFRLLYFLEDHICGLADCAEDFQRRLDEAEAENKELLKPPALSEWRKVRRRASAIWRGLDSLQRPGKPTYPNELTEPPYPRD